MGARSSAEQQAQAGLATVPVTALVAGTPIVTTQEDRSLALQANNIFRTHRLELEDYCLSSSDSSPRDKPVPRSGESSEAAKSTTTPAAAWTATDRQAHAVHPPASPAPSAAAVSTAALKAAIKRAISHGNSDWQLLQRNVAQLLASSGPPYTAGWDTELKPKLNKSHVTIPRQHIKALQACRYLEVHDGGRGHAVRLLADSLLAAAATTGKQLSSAAPLALSGAEESDQSVPVCTVQMTPVPAANVVNTGESRAGSSRTAGNATGTAPLSAGLFDIGQSTTAQQIGSNGQLNLPVQVPAADEALRQTGMEAAHDAAMDNKAALESHGGPNIDEGRFVSSNLPCFAVASGLATLLYRLLLTPAPKSGTGAAATEQVQDGNVPPVSLSAGDSSSAANDAATPGGLPDNDSSSAVHNTATVNLPPADDSSSAVHNTATASVLSAAEDETSALRRACADEYNGLVWQAVSSVHGLNVAVAQLVDRVHAHPTRAGDNGAAAVETLAAVTTAGPVEAAGAHAAAAGVALASDDDDDIMTALRALHVHLNHSTPDDLQQVGLALQMYLDEMDNFTFATHSNNAAPVP